MVLIGGALLVVSLVEGSETGRRADGAVRLVPANALLYVHARVEPDGGQWRRAAEIVRELPALSRLRNQALDSLSSGRRPLDFDTQVRPWIGDEAALALLPDGTRATSLILVRVGDETGARRFLEGAGKPRSQRHRGVTVRVYGDLAAAFVGNFLAIGRPENVRAAIDARRARSLGATPLFRRAVESLQLKDPLAYAYAPERGLTQVLRDERGVAGQIGALLDRPGLTAAAAAVRTEPNGIRLGFATLAEPAEQTAKQFRPTLTRQVPAGTIAYLGASGPDGVLDQLQRLGGGTQSSLPPLLERVRRPLGLAGEAAVTRAVRPLLDRESALIVTPPVSRPVVTLVVADTSPQEGGDVLVALQPVIARLLEEPSQLGQIPTLQQRRIGGVEATSLRLSPTLEVTYAAFDDMLVVSTSAAGIRQIQATGYSLEQNAAFATRLRDFLDRASSVVFLDLRRLTSLVERAGLSATPGYRAIKPDIARFGAVSGITASQRSSQTTEIFVEVP